MGGCVCLAEARGVGVAEVDAVGRDAPGVVGDVGFIVGIATGVSVTAGAVLPGIGIARFVGANTLRGSTGSTECVGRGVGLAGSTGAVGATALIGCVSTPTVSTVSPSRIPVPPYGGKYSLMPCP